MHKIVSLIAFAALCGCDPALQHVEAPVLTSEQIGHAVEKVTPARQEIQKAATEIKVTAKTADPARAAPALAKIDKQADVVIESAARIAEQEPALVAAAQTAVAAEAESVTLTAEVDSLTATVKEMKERDESWARKIALSIIGLTAVACGVGFWLKNIRLTVSAAVSGGVGVVLSIIAGAVYAWRGVIVISLGVAVAVAIVAAAICMFIEWRKNGSLANVFRETDVVPK